MKKRRSRTNKLQCMMNDASLLMNYTAPMKEALTIYLRYRLVQELEKLNRRRR